jgi:hypothetical protein
MNRIVLVVVGLALIAGLWFGLSSREKSPDLPEGSSSGEGISNESHPANEDGSDAAVESSGGDAGKRGEEADSSTGEPGSSAESNGSKGGEAAKAAGGSVPMGGAASESTGSTGTTGSTSSGSTDSGSANSKNKILNKGGLPTEMADGVDGNLPKSAGGYQGEDGDDGEGAPAPKPKVIPKLAGVAGAKVWLVASDLKKLPGAKKGSFEVGDKNGSKKTTWMNRSGSKLGDGVFVKNGTTATFLKGVSTPIGPVDAVAFCGAAAKECLNSAPSQIKLGVDINHPESWLAGPDKVGKSPKGGSSFTTLFVAIRGGASAIPLMENQNGEGGARVGPFLGWIGPDLVGSIHGLQGIVGLTSVAIPSPWSPPAEPEIYTLRFDRKKSELRLFEVGSKNSATQVQELAKGDGPDNDQYAAIAMGSKNPGSGAPTSVLEVAAYSRALTDREICTIHKDFNTRHKLKIPSSKLKPCQP